MRTHRVALLLGLLLATCACALPLVGGFQLLENGTTAPFFSLPSLAGETVSLSDFERGPVILNFWTTTCPACFEELPVLADLEHEFGADGLSVVTICLGSPAEEVRQALQRANVDLLVLVDEDAETVQPYQVSGTPTTYLIDGQGVIVMSNAGYGTGVESRLRAGIERALEE